MNPIYFPLILIAIAILLVLFGKAVDFENEKFCQNAGRAQGLVVENKICWGRIIVVRPIVRFITQQGEIVQAIDEKGLAMAIPRFSKGQNITLLYNKENPYDFRIITNGDFA
jgi:hypothetical protein